jgi:hypothetical protein
MDFIQVKTRDILFAESCPENESDHPMDSPLENVVTVDFITLDSFKCLNRFDRLPPWTMSDLN